MFPIEPDSTMLGGSDKDVDRPFPIATPQPQDRTGRKGLQILRYQARFLPQLHQSLLFGFNIGIEEPSDAMPHSDVTSYERTPPQQAQSVTVLQQQGDDSPFHGLEQVRFRY